MRHQTLQAQTRLALSYVDASADRNSTTQDMLNWQGLRAIIHVHSVAAGASCTYTLYESDAADMTGQTAVPQAVKAVADTDDGIIIILDHVAPKKRYYRLTADKSVGNVAESGVWEQYQPKLTNPTDIAAEIASVKTYSDQGVYAYS